VNFPTVPLPLRFDGQTKKLGWLYWLSQANQTGGDDRPRVWILGLSSVLPDLPRPGL